MEERRRMRSDKEIEWLASFRSNKKLFDKDIREPEDFSIRVEVLITPKLSDVIDKVVRFEKETFENRSTFLRSCAIRYLKERGDWPC